MIRAVLFDTETTGLDPLTGDRVIEIAALELVGDIPTGKTFHVLLDPERDIPAEATRVHGFTNGDLAGKPRFAAVADEMLAFFADSKLIAHNAPFDFRFINAELARIKRPSLAMERMVDTLALAKQRFPGMPNSLDALCRRYLIDLSARTTHNALLDCKLLAEVYIELTGGRQRGLSLAAAGSETRRAAEAETYAVDTARAPRPMPVSEAELSAHLSFLKKVKQPVWLASESA
jgi:DNA polymerase-3 subunit epsilon